MYETSVATESDNNEAHLLVKREPDDLFELNYFSNPEEESVSYLRQMLRLAKRKMRSKKINNAGKVRWARAGIEASKVLLYSGVIERVERRRINKDKDWIKDVLRDALTKTPIQETSTVVG